MSEHYKALTRKYRPVNFEDIVSQEHVSSTLKNAIESNRLTHAYLFCGPRGVGKTTMARVLARTINEIDEQVDGEALNQTLNIIEVDAASNNKVEDAHRIREAVRVPPQSGRYKIFIIDEVHMLSKSAFNALLKTLEEPPPYAIFIFATTEPHKVLPTILSRVQRFDFRPIQVNEIVDRLKSICKNEGITIDDESLHIIARKADGALRDALGLLDQVVAFCGTDIKYADLQKSLSVIGTDILFTLTEHIRDSDTSAGIRLLHEQLMAGYDIQEFLIALTEHFRNLLLARDQKNLFAIETGDDIKKRLIEYASFFSEEDLMRMLHIVQDAQFKIRETHQPRILVEMTILRLIKMERSEGLKKLLAEIAELKKSLEGIPASTTEDSGNPYTPQARKPGAGQQATSTNRPNAVASTTASLGTPSITGRPKNRLTSVKREDSDEASQKGNAMSYEGNLALASDPDDEPADSGSVDLHQVRRNWAEFIEEAKKAVPGFVSIVLESTKPVKINRNELILLCNDDLAARLVEEHGDILQESLTGFFGHKLRVSCIVSSSRKGGANDNDPYERFRRLVKLDPKLKLIVDVFGAELEPIY